MKEFIVTRITALESPHSIKDTGTGKVFPMVTLELELMSPPNQRETALFHFPPSLLETALPKMQGTTQLALMQSTEPGTRH